MPMLTALPVLIPVSETECRTVKAVMDSPSHIKNMIGFLFFFPTQMQLSSLKKWINSEQPGNYFHSTDFARAALRVPWGAYSRSFAPRWGLWRATGDRLCHFGSSQEWKFQAEAPLLYHGLASIPPPSWYLSQYLIPQHLPQNVTAEGRTRTFTWSPNPMGLQLSPYPAVPWTRHSKTTVITRYKVKNPILT